VGTSAREAAGITAFSLAPGAGEASFHALADSIDQMIWSTRPDGYHDYYNRRWYDFTGVAEGSTDGDCWNAMFHPEDRERAWEVWRRSLATGDSYHIEYRLRHRSGEYRWVLGRAQPVRDGAGAIRRWYGSCTDIHELRLAQDAARRAEERYRLAFRATKDAIWDCDLTTDELDWNEALQTAYGYDPDTVRVTAAWWLGHIHPDDRERVDASARAAIAGTGSDWSEEYRFRRADGSYAQVLDRATVIRNESGFAVRMIGAMLDLSERKDAEKKLRESEARQRAITEATPECIKIVAADGRLVHMNPAGLGMIEAADLETVREADTLSLIAPEHRDLWRANHARVLAGEAVNWEFDLIGLRGTRRRMETHAVPLTLPDGSVAQLAVTRDVSERKRAEEHQKLLINELNHRVKNTLAIVQGIAQQSFKGDNAAPEARRAFEGRLSALSAAHNVLTDRSWAPVSMAQIVEDAVAPYRGHAGGFEIEGPPVPIPPKAAVSLALTVHELTTNAVKYGALSSPSGRVSVGWSVEDGRLRFVWRESGGPAVTAPAKRGFGTRMIERGLAGELDGTATIEFREEGVVCTVDAPLPGTA
jgi:PAS domain S-box-containing protein